MDLQDFIKTSIISISKAITETQQELAETGVIVNPEYMGSGSEGLHLKSDEGRRYVQSLEFDVALTVEETTKTDVSGSLKVLVAKLGTDGTAIEKNQNVSRLKFSIPVAFATSDTPIKYKTNPNKGKYTIA